MYTKRNDKLIGSARHHLRNRPSGPGSLRSPLVLPLARGPGGRARRSPAEGWRAPPKDSSCRAPRMGTPSGCCEPGPPGAYGKRRMDWPAMAAQARCARPRCKGPSLRILDDGWGVGSPPAFGWRGFGT